MYIHIFVYVVQVICRVWDWQVCYLGRRLSLTTIDRYLYACGSIIQYYLPTQWLLFWAEISIMHTDIGIYVRDRCKTAGPF